jgi:hypothetical protein
LVPITGCAWKLDNNSNVLLPVSGLIMATENKVTYENYYNDYRRISCVSYCGCGHWRNTAHISIIKSERWLLCNAHDAYNYTPLTPKPEDFGLR